MKPQFQPTLRSLRRHRVPAWYEDAKFGIFIHWSVSSVIGWAPRDREINEVLRTEYDRAQAILPYTEWYQNALRTPGTPVALYHEKTYGSRTYDSFAPEFERGIEAWNPEEWAAAFRRAGARYVVLVTKHHDGYCLWPSRVPHPRRNGWRSQRDCVAELATAVRSEGMRFGVYYSGGLDWTFEPMPLRTMGDVLASIPRGDYPGYAEAQVRELIDHVRPDVLWNDIAWPTSATPQYRLFCDYYDRVPEGVVNDRWIPWSPWVAAMRYAAPRKALDALLRHHFRRPDTALTPPGIGYYDYQTPEYVSFPDVQRRKWECVRGMDKSFGFNQNSLPEDFLSHEDLVHSLADITAKNGNLLLNVGPRGVDATIPEPQMERLRWIGDWLATNGEAIYGTRPWVRAEGRTTEGTPVRFTARDRNVYAIVLGPPGETITLPGFRASRATQVRALGAPQAQWSAGPSGIAVTGLEQLRRAPATVIAIEASERSD